MKISAVILTQDEELHIERCMKSIEGIADEIIIIDSGSSDATMSLVSKPNCKVYVNDWINYATQFQFGVDRASHDWILRIDADEIIDDCLEKEIIRFKKLEASVHAVTFDRYMYFLGQVVKFGGVLPVKVIRLFDRNKGHIENRWMDEHIITTGKVCHLSGSLIDNNLKSLSWWIDKHNKYSNREALEVLMKEYNLGYVESTASFQFRHSDKLKRFLKEKIYYKISPGLRSLIYFFYRYFICLGIFDTHGGRKFHLLQGLWYRYLVDCKIYEVKQSVKGGRDLETAIYEILGIKL